MNSQKAGVESGLSIQKGRTKKTLQKKIQEAEKQLSKAASSMSEPEPLNSQTERNVSSTEMATEKSSMLISERCMVAPGSKDAPKFQSSKPEELRHFIRLMEDLWRDAGVTKDETKKMMIGKYADQDSEEEWAAFETFSDGHSWDEFKDELIANYPEAAAAERGTPARIRQLCRGTEKVGLGDMPALYAFRRAFMAEAKKLQKPPAAMANRELVELFISCLSESLASALLQHLGNQYSNPSTISNGKRK